MPPPANTTAATAVDMGALPYSTTQTGIHDAGTTYTVWYSFTATLTGVVGLFGYGDLTTYRPTTEVFTGPNSGSLSGWPTTTPIFAENKAVQFPVTSGDTYWISFTPNAGNPTPATLTLDVLMGANDAQTADRLIVNDDTDGFPAIVLNASSGAPIAFLSLPAGEGGDILPTGQIVMSDAWNGNLQLYADSTFTSPTTLAWDIGFSTALRAQRTLSRFYAGKNINPTQVRAYDETGAIVATYTLTGNNGIAGVAASNDGSIIYHGRSTNKPLKRWLTGTSADGTDLAAAAGANITAGQDILVLGDDTILASFVNQVTGQFDVKQFTDGGTVLNTYAIAATSSLPASTPPRLAYGEDDTTFWVWWHPDTTAGSSRFQEIAVSGGAVLRDVVTVEFESGVSQEDETATPTARFGNSFSCPFFLIPGSPPLVVDLSEECCPCDCPTPRGPSGSPTTAPLPSHTGAILPPVVPDDWTPQCTGGGDVPSAADATDPESWVQ